jgi:Uma2 family endonuclease
MGAVKPLPQSRPLTRVDLAAMPDDGHRYELIDGALLVTPAPSRRHQTAVGELFVLLRDQCPVELQVLIAPFDVVLGESTVVQPDIVVARRSDLTERDLPTAPLLSVEVLSPSTKHIDLMFKRSRFEAAGCPSYWVADPEGPAITAWELQDGKYVEVAHVTGDDRLEIELPFPVGFSPIALLG